MAYKISLAFFAVLIFGAYSAPAETSEDQSPKSDTEAKSVLQCHNGTYTNETQTLSEISSKLKLIPCHEGSCFGRKSEGNYTFGCTTDRPDIKNGNCKVSNNGKNNVSITECHCHEDSCILPLMYYCNLLQENSEFLFC